MNSQDQLASLQEVNNTVRIDGNVTDDVAEAGQEDVQDDAPGTAANADPPN
jgi:hypothetical protein